jgi:DNA modification methylase
MPYVSNTSNETVESVAMHTIIDTNRQRKDYGDVSGLAASIKQFGIIQPIVLQRQADGIVLVAGGRRLAALRSINTTELHHGKEFIWRDEDLSTPEGSLRLSAVELEENLRRKDLSWSETILAKQRLFILMQSIHGASRGFGEGKSAAANDGFSLRKLAAMLGENHSVTSRDLQLADFVVKHPILASMPTKADALRKLGVAVTVAAMQVMAKKSVVTSGATGIAPAGTPTLPRTAGDVTTTGADASPNAVMASAPDTLTPHDLITIESREQTKRRWVLYEGNFQDQIGAVVSESVDLILTDLPYNIGLGTATASHSAGLGQFDDSDIDMVTLCADVAVESFRTLRPNRFAVFFYGMNYHGVLYDALTTAGFSVDPYSFIWLRDRTAPPDGFARYSKSFDPAFVASKGTPRFIRPNLPNTIAIPSVRGAERLHAAQKPLALMQKFVEDMTTPDCVVLDMFAGAGTTGEAALRTKRKAILFEREAQNCLLIRSRLGIL